MQRVILSSLVVLGLALSGCQTAKENPNAAKGAGIGAGTPKNA